MGKRKDTKCTVCLFYLLFFLPWLNLSAFGVALICWQTKPAGARLPECFCHIQHKLFSHPSLHLSPLVNDSDSSHTIVRSRLSSRHTQQFQTAFFSSANSFLLKHENTIPYYHSLNTIFGNKGVKPNQNTCSCFHFCNCWYQFIRVELQY